MIWESCHWKEALLKDRAYLSRFRIRRATRENTLAGVEKRIFISFYAIRKLMDAEKLSTSNPDSRWPVVWYPNVARVDTMNWHRIDEKYDLNSKHHEFRTLVWLCNQVIHSYVFILTFAESGIIDGVFVASDRQRNKRVSFFCRKTIMDILKLIGNDYPAHACSVRDDDGQWKTTQW